MEKQQIFQCSEDAVARCALLVKNGGGDNKLIIKPGSVGSELHVIEFYY
jgi:hypothetical protein